MIYVMPSFLLVIMILQSKAYYGACVISRQVTGEPLL